MSRLKELEFAARTLVRFPWTHGAAAFILAVALGAVLCIASIMDEMLWSPLPGIDRAERVGWLFVTRGGGDADTNSDALALPNARYYREHAESFESVAWFTSAKRVLAGRAEPEMLSGFAVSEDFFHLFGTSPRLGRLLGPADVASGAPPVVVLGEAYWRRRFNADPALVGQELDLDGVRHTVVGISPERFFAQIGATIEIWLPQRPAPEDWTNRQLSVPTLVRLRPSLGFDAANRELERLSLEIAKAHPLTDQGFAAKAVPLPNVMARFRPLAFALMLAALFVLGAAGANAASLLLAQTAERTRELALRRALGASPWSLLGQWCLQVSALMLLAIGAGTLLGRWALDALVASMPGSMKMSDFGTPEASLSWRSWLGMVAVALVATPLIGLVPARQAARIAIAPALRDGGGGAIGVARGRLVRRLLVGLQVTLAAALTVGAALAYVGFVRARDVPLGFETAHVIQLGLPNHARAPADRAAFLERLVMRGGLAKAGSGGVPDAAAEVRLALVSDPPLTRTYASQSFLRDGEARPPPDRLPWGKRNRVSPGYFELLGIPLLSGRPFGASDGPNAPCVAIFSRALARTTFASESVIGRRIRLDPVGSDDAGDSASPPGTGSSRAADESCEIVGVVADVRDALEGSPGDLYLPTAQSAQAAGTLLVRGGTSADLARLQAEIRGFDPQQVIGERPLDDRVAVASWGFNLLAALFIGLAAVGLSLAAVGTYAMLAHTASVRWRELGLRAVLGAEPRELAWLVVKDNLWIGTLAIGVGVGAVALGTTLVASYNPGVGVYLEAAVLTAALLAGASLLSARRVSTIDAGLALRRR